MCEHAHIAVRKCPFLASLAREQGEGFATSIAIAPTKPVGAEPLPQGTDAVVGLASSFRLFHGPDGLLPLTHRGPQRGNAASGPRSGCPYHARALAPPAAAVAPPTASQHPSAPFAAISLSNFGKGPNFGDFLRKHLKNGLGSSHSKPQRPQQRPGPSSSSSSGGAAKPPHGPASTNTGSSSSLKPQGPLGDPAWGGGSGGAPSTAGGGGGGGAGRSFHSGPGGSKPPGAGSTTVSSGSSTSLPSSALGSSTSSSASASPASGWSSTGSSSGSVRGPSPFQQRPGAGTSGSSKNTSRGTGGASNRTNGSSSSGGGRSGGPKGPSLTTSTSSRGGPAPACPLRKWLGPMAGLVFNQYDKLVCPPAIMAARAALAKTAAVQTLRPQALPVKLVAVAAVVAGSNIPCGAVREHFEKFSLGWFVAVHATIPFVAMLRKAVIMPKYAIVVTIAAAVAGQLVGSRLERLRLQYEQQHGPLLPALQLPGSLLVGEAAPQRGGPLSSEPAHSSSSSSSTVVGQPGRGRSTAQRDGKGGRGWREALAADPEPAADGLFGTCSASAAAAGAGGLFARLPLVTKA